MSDKSNEAMLEMLGTIMKATKDVFIHEHGAFTNTCGPDCGWYVATKKSVFDNVFDPDRTGEFSSDLAPTFPAGEVQFTPTSSGDGVTYIDARPDAAAIPDEEAEYIAVEVESDDD